MLILPIPEREWFDECKGEYFTTSACELKLEHSLLSISKWESKWCVPFLDKFTKKDNIMMLDYVKCMALNNPPEWVYNVLTESDYNKISEYIKAPMTATTISERPGSSANNRDIITSEIIYLLMFKHNVPKECEKWHLNRLVTLLKAAEEYSKEPEKMDERAIMEENRRINEARKRQYRTKG